MHLAVLAEPPLDPSADQARRLLEHELSKPKYGDRRTLLQRLMDWLDERLTELTNSVGGLSTGWLLLLLAAIAVLIGFGLTKVRRRQGPGRGHDDAEPVVSDELNADDLRRLAARALSDGDHTLAYVQYFRAIATRGVERAIVSARPGATAHEVAGDLARAFVDRRVEIDRCAARFDEVRYGGQTPARHEVESIRTLEESLARSRPHQFASVS